MPELGRHGGGRVTRSRIELEVRKLLSSQQLVHAAACVHAAARSPERRADEFRGRACTRNGGLELGRRGGEREARPRREAPWGSPLADPLILHVPLTRCVATSSAGAATGRSSGGEAARCS